MKRYVVFQLLVLISLPMLAVEVTVSAEGKDEKAAVLKALAKAVRQVNGIQVGEKDRVRKRVENFVDDVTKYLETSETYKSDIRSATWGYVESYELLSNEKKGGLVKVKLKANINKFDPAKLQPGVPPQSWSCLSQLKKININLAKAAR